MANERKIILEREYVVPMRRGWTKVPIYLRANKAVKTLKEFIAQHMKIYDRDLRKVNVDILLNNEIRFRGKSKPLGKIKVKAIKYDDGEVVVKLFQLPKHLEFQVAREARIAAEQLKEQTAAPKKEEKPAKAEESKDTKEKETSSKLAEEAIDKAAAKTAKHTSKTKAEGSKMPRKTLSV